MHLLPICLEASYTLYFVTAPVEFTPFTDAVYFRALMCSQTSASSSGSMAFHLLLSFACVSGHRPLPNCPLLSPVFTLFVRWTLHSPSAELLFFPPPSVLHSFSSVFGSDSACTVYHFYPSHPPPVFCLARGSVSGYVSISLC